MKDEVLKVQDLTKIYPNGKVAVNKVSFTLNKGEIFGMLGPNGSGKTTTILMLLGLLDATKGSVSVLGYNPLRTPLEVKKRVSYLPDSVGFYSNLTAYENVDYTTRFLNLDGKERRARIDKAFKKIRLYNNRDDKIKTFSHGMKQRLGLAEVLIKEPDIAILDEPTQGLDPESVAEFLDIIRSFRDDENMSVLISSHQLNQVQSVCNRVGLFSQGSLITYGTVKELSEEQFGTNRIINLTLEEDADISEITHSIEGINQTRKIAPGQWIFTCTKDIRSKLVKALVDNRLNINSVNLQLHSLEDIYRSFFEEVKNVTE
ncbi:MAG: ABC transporter ATP-binding protein [Sphaerochaetaceae bacterium]